MKITRLTAENIKRIKAVDITPDGNLVVIGGRNAQGKTSVLDSITYALAGALSHPDQPIRDGQDKAKIVCELDDLIVTRTFTPKGGSLIVSNKEGAKYASPQAMLDELTGKLTFDPLAFSRMPPKEQVNTLKSLVGLDFSELDERRQELYDERTLVNREVSKQQANVGAMPEFPDAPDDEVSISELMKELAIRESHNRFNEAKRVEMVHADTRVLNQSCKVAKLEQELKEAKVALAGEQAKLRVLQAEVEPLKGADEQEIRNQIEGADMINRKVRSNRVRAQRKQGLESKQQETADLSAEIQTIDDDKITSLSDAKFPIAGLSFNSSTVLFNGLPFNQASSAEQLRVSVAMGLAINPDIKVLLIRDGSLLDEDNLAIIAKMVTEADAQIWIERVGDDDEMAIIIEDGTIRANTRQSHRVLV